MKGNRKKGWGVKNKKQCRQKNAGRPERSEGCYRNMTISESGME